MSEIKRDFQLFAKPLGSNCNLGCSYCYYINTGSGNAGKGGVIDPELLEVYIEQHFEATTNDTVFFSWHGGEPMLAGLEFYKDVLRIQERYNTKGRRVLNGMQTNGTMLTGEWGAFLKENDFIVGLSLDGPEKYHNRYRKNLNQEGSFKDVIKGWNILQEYGVTSEILCTLNDYNSLHPVGIYNFFRDIGARYITFLPVVEQSDNGELAEWSVRPEVFGNFLISVFEEWKRSDIGKIEIQIIEEAMRTALKEEHSLCILREECGGVPVLEKNGNVYCCDHYVSPDSLLGNISKIALSQMLDSEQLRNFGRIKSSTLPGKCLRCEVLDMCNGGCPKNRIVESPGEANKINYLCPGYLSFLRHIKPFTQLVASLSGSS
jgi:uncharacterized protein